MDKQQLLNAYVSSIQKRRSSNAAERQDIIHGEIASNIRDLIDEEKFEVISKNTEGGKEFHFSGLLFGKNTDIVILDKKTKAPVAAIPVKFIFSNYNQNWKNYFEQMIAETFNLKLSGIKVYNVMIIRKNTPYFKDGRKKISKIEEQPKKEDYINSFKNFSEIFNGNLTDGILYLSVDFNDKEINEKYIKIGDIDWEKYKNELETSVSVDNISISYPMNDDVSLSLEYKDFLNKIVSDLSKDNDEENDQIFKEVDEAISSQSIICEYCGEKFSNKSELKYHVNCVVSPEERTKHK